MGTYRVIDPVLNEVTTVVRKAKVCLTGLTPSVPLGDASRSSVSSLVLDQFTFTKTLVASWTLEKSVSR